ncbi:unnamed protein product, partial [Ceratitis capitata]
MPNDASTSQEAQGHNHRLTYIQRNSAHRLLMTKEGYGWGSISKPGLERDRFRDIDDHGVVAPVMQ